MVKKDVWPPVSGKDEQSNRREVARCLTVTSYPDGRRVVTFKDRDAWVRNGGHKPSTVPQGPSINEKWHRR
jgi:hypothetical protein